MSKTTTTKPDLALRKAVAEAVGWQGVRKLKYDDGPGYGLVAYVAPDGVDPGNEFGFGFYVPAYELDIAAAWLLVEEMGEDVRRMTPAIQKRWGIEVTLGSDDPDNYCVIVEPTAPLAICKAFLAWKEQQ